MESGGTDQANFQVFHDFSIKVNGTKFVVIGSDVASFTFLVRNASGSLVAEWAGVLRVPDNINISRGQDSYRASESRQETLATGNYTIEWNHSMPLEFSLNQVGRASPIRTASTVVGVGGILVLLIAVVVWYHRRKQEVPPPQVQPPYSSPPSSPSEDSSPPRENL